MGQLPGRPGRGAEVIEVWNPEHREQKPRCGRQGVRGLLGRGLLKSELPCGKVHHVYPSGLGGPGSGKAIGGSWIPAFLSLAHNYGGRDVSDPDSLHHSPQTHLPLSPTDERPTQEENGRILCLFYEIEDVVQAQKCHQIP